jgi:hypothetical protein
VAPLLKAVRTTGTFCLPAVAAVVSEQVVDAPTLRLVAEHFMPAGVTTARLLTGASPVLETVTDRTTGDPLATVGPGSEVARLPFTAGSVTAI